MIPSLLDGRILWVRVPVCFPSQLSFCCFRLGLKWFQLFFLPGPQFGGMKLRLLFKILTASAGISSSVRFTKGTGGRFLARFSFASAIMRLLAKFSAAASSNYWWVLDPGLRLGSFGKDGYIFETQTLNRLLGSKPSFHLWQGWKVTLLCVETDSRLFQCWRIWTGLWGACNFAHHGSLMPIPGCEAGYADQNWTDVALREALDPQIGQCFRHPVKDFLLFLHNPLHDSLFVLALLGWKAWNIPARFLITPENVWWLIIHFQCGIVLSQRRINLWENDAPVQTLAWVIGKP